MMSGKIGLKPDRRVRRTRDTLGDALVELIEEQPFDDITVQAVLDRAGVSRTTFYAHYRDKQDLFLSEVEDFFELLGTLLERRKAPVQRLIPVEELFAHLMDVRGFHEALIASGKANDIRELGTGCFARSIQGRLRGAGVDLPEQELAATGHALAGSVFSLMEWWMNQGRRITPAKMDELFHRMAWRGLKPSMPKVNKT